MFDKRQINTKKIIFRVIGILIVVMLFIFVYDNVDDLQEIIHHMQKIPLQIILILITLQVITQLLLAMQWYKISNVIIENSNFYKMFYILTTGSVIEAVTPGAKVGGEVTRLYYLKKEFNCPTDVAVNIIIIQKSISMSVLFTIGLTSFVYLITQLADYFPFLIKLLIAITAIVSIFFLVSLLFFTDKLVMLLEKSNSKFLQKANKYVKSYSKSVSRLDKRQWLLQFTISMLVWLLFPFKMYILTTSAGLDINFFVVLAITMTSYMVGMLPLTPGGIGTFESSMINFLLSLPNLAIDLALSVSITIVFRFITFWFVMLFSLAFILIKLIIDFLRN